MRMNAPDKVPTKRATNVSLRADLIDEAKRLNINVSQACEAGLAAEVKKAREEKWIADNWQAIQSSNAYVEKHGLPLAGYRQF
jgi:antitoxin CcdA